MVKMMVVNDNNNNNKTNKNRVNKIWHLDCISVSGRVREIDNVSLPLGADDSSAGEALCR